MMDYKRLLIWQKGMEIVEHVYHVIADLPMEERYGLRSQATRAAVSIVLNIAEGNAKSSSKEYKKYLEVALGSAFELETVFHVMMRLNLLSHDKTDALLSEILIEQKMINSFIRTIKPKENK